jgi:hypothetical protein
MGSDIIKMLGGSQLRGVLTGQIHPGSLQKLNEPMKLAGSKKRVNRIGKQQNICFLDGGQSRGEVLFQGLDLLTHMKNIKLMLRKQNSQIVDGLQRDGMLALGASVQNQYIHRKPHFLMIADPII